MPRSYWTSGISVTSGGSERSAYLIGIDLEEFQNVEVHFLLSEQPSVHECLGSGGRWIVWIGKSSKE